MRQGSGTCSATLLEMHTSTASVRTGRAIPLPRIDPVWSRPAADISPTSGSTETYRAPSAAYASEK